MNHDSSQKGGHFNSFDMMTKKVETDTTVALSTCHDGDSGEIAHYCKYILYSENDKNDRNFELVI